MPRARSAALVLALLTIAVGWTWNTRVAGGADSYGYVSQADLWRHGRLTIDQPFVRDVPWPLAGDTFSPLGYRPASDPAQLVPIYSPGLPMLMALAQMAGGISAAFWIVPLAGGVLVLATFAIGRRVLNDGAALAAAAFVATSPTFLYMVVQPMSDIPAAAAWAAAVACLLEDSAAASAAAGVSASIAVLIRPNLVAIAIVLATWALLRRRPYAAVFIALASVGPAVIALIDARIHGSPFASGYDLTGAFSFAYVPANVRQFGTWLLTVDPALAIGAIALAAFARRFVVLGAVAVVVVLSYLVYVPFDAWWYLRYLLPAWPMFAIGAAALAARTGRAMVPIVAAIALVGVWQATRRGAFSLAPAEAKYVNVAQVVRTTTAPRDVIVSVQHSGSLRYYANRLTLRWDFMDPLWLDRAVDWLSAHGHHTYLVLDADEVVAVRERFAQSSAVGRLDWPPMISYAEGTTLVFDAVTRDPNKRTLAIAPRLRLR